MCCKGFIKRFVPFFLTFAVGLFIASFFVSIALPNVNFKRDFRKHRQYHRMMEMENQRLRDENFRLKQELTERSTFEMNTLKLDVPPPPPLPPVPARTIPYRGR